MPEFNRQDEPPPPGPNMTVRRIRALQRLQFVLLGQPWGTWTHYNGRSTEPCLKPKKECPGCKRQLAHRWKCYIHVWNLQRQTDEFLELTPASRAQLDDQLPTGEPYRGQRIEVARGKGDKSRLTVLLLPAVPVHGKMPESKDPYKLLCKLWGFPQITEEKPPQSDLPPGLVG